MQLIKMASLVLAGSLSLPVASQAATLKVVFQQATVSSGIAEPRKSERPRLTMWFANSDVTGPFTQFVGSDLVQHLWEFTDGWGEDSQVATLGLFDSSVLGADTLTVGISTIGGLNQTLAVFDSGGSAQFRAQFIEDATGSTGQQVLSGFRDTAGRFTITADLNKDGVQDVVSARMNQVTTETEFNQIATSIAAPVPLPAGLPMVLSGLAIFGLMKRQRTRS
ncbi:MAG: VPLPA-CTERM sorting domain-containing protein [Aliishimia sp.]